MSPADRGAELAANLAAVRARIAAATAAAGRAAEEVTLVAVSKTFSATDVVHLLELGVVDFGENRDKEAAAKAAAVSELAPGQPLRWHFVGQVQRKKAKSVAAYADVVHSVDRPELADALGRAAVRAGRGIDALVQIDLDSPDIDGAHIDSAAIDGAHIDSGVNGRGGVRPNDVVALAEYLADSPGLRLAGVMALAPLGGDPDAAFARLAVLAEGVRGIATDAVVISAGMSGDLEAAIRHGATHVRVGTALFGGRPIKSDHVR